MNSQNQSLLSLDLLLVPDLTGRVKKVATEGGERPLLKLFVSLVFYQQLVK
jgi:hypothetical protein